MFKNTLNVTKADRLIELSGRQEQVPVRQLRCPLRAWEGGVAWEEKCCSPRTEGGNCQPGCEASGDRSSGTPQAGKSQAEGKQAQPGRREEGGGLRQGLGEEKAPKYLCRGPAGIRPTRRGELRNQTSPGQLQLKRMQGTQEPK